MIPEVWGLLPSGVSPLVAAGLIVAAFFASMLTSALSIGGGLLMFSILALVFPPSTLVPVHGAVQFGSNFGRAFVQRAHIQWRLVLWMSLGAVLGSAVGGRFASLLPEDVFRIVIALFMLAIIWLPQPKVEGRGPVASFIGGAVIAFLGMIVGVTGPIVLAFIRGISDRHQLVGTHATLMSIQTFAKVTTFMAYGFAFWEFVPLILVMIASGFAGTWVGSFFLGRMPERTFRFAFRILLSVIALDLLRRAVFPA